MLRPKIEEFGKLWHDYDSCRNVVPIAIAVDSCIAVCADCRRTPPPPYQVLTGATILTRVGFTFIDFWRVSAKIIYHISLYHNYKGFVGKISFMQDFKGSLSFGKQHHGHRIMLDTRLLVVISRE